jgi:precorrin-2 dehydrogenase/sirohydrochlorin ferrochelatase
MSYLVDLELRGKNVLVVGGGRLAEAHSEQLVQAGANPKVVALEVTTAMSALIERYDLTLEQRDYYTADLEDAWLVLALTDEPQTNAAICREADALGKLAYGDGDGYKGNIALPAVMRRGSLVLAVETGLPHLAKQILRELEEDFGPEWTAYMQKLDLLRDRIASIPDALERQRVIHRLTSPAMLALVRSGDTQEWQDHLDQVSSEVAARSEPERV